MQTLLKGLERLILWELEENTLRNNPICKTQYGFKKGTSTEHAISHFVDDVESAILRNNYALAVFCDIEGAFDRVEFNSCIKTLEEKNFPPKILNSPNCSTVLEVSTLMDDFCKKANTSLSAIS